MEHTQGNWRIADGYNEITTSKIGILEGSKSICRLSTFSKNEGEIKANARLIASAPELLEGLKEAVQFIDDCGAQAGVIAIIEKLEKIINKATIHDIQH